MNNLKLITDQNLYQLCKTYGAHALEWRRKFIGLLPEVNRRKLYEKKGFGSIFEFAKKLAGLSEEQVKRVLSLEQKFREFPALLALLVNGEVSVNKLARVVSIANSENQEFLASQVLTLSQGAVETLVNDKRWADKKIADTLETNLLDDSSDRHEWHCENQNGLFEAKTEDKFVRTHKSTQSTFAESSDDCTLNLSPEVHQKLLELQQKGLDLNQILIDFLRKRELEIAQKKEQISEKVLRKEEEKAQKAEIIQEYSLESVEPQNRHISRATKKILHEEFGTKCAVKFCQKSAENIHHTLHFSIGKTNDPRFLLPLCKEHHELEHAVNLKYKEARM